MTKLCVTCKDSKSDKYSSTVSGSVVGLMVVLLPVLVLVNGCVVTILWGWFVAPLVGVELAVAHGCGLYLLVHVLIYGATSAKPCTTEQAYKVLVGNLLVDPFITLGLGCLFHLFV